MNLLVIGAGNMGLTYAEAMSRSAVLGNNKIQIFDTDDQKQQELTMSNRFEVFPRLSECLPHADVVFIAVKPHQSEELFHEMRPMVKHQQLIVSVMAGVSIETIMKELGINKVIRAMPNLPAKVGKGMTAYTESKEVSRLELLLIQRLLDTTGTSIHVATEEFIDASTGISGSGPAYVFYFMQSMMEAASKMGFSEADAKQLVSSTFEGAIQLFNQSDLTPDGWMSRVASKGGTTEAALNSMKSNKVNELIKEAAYAAFHRAVELGKKEH